MERYWLLKPGLCIPWGSTSTVTPSLVREALLSMDPGLDRQTLDSCVSQVFQIPVRELAEAEEEEERQIPLSLAMERLQSIDIVRTGLREQDPAKAAGATSLPANP